MNRTRHEVLGIDEPLDLVDHIQIPPQIGRGVYKCRVVYGKEVMSVVIEKYRRRKIRSLMLVDGGDIDYKYKYADRSAIDALYALRGDCDDILIVQDGLITDTSYANVALWDGENWCTPSTPLLAGTRRQLLIDDGVIEERKIRVSDLHKYQCTMLFNALMEFDVRNALQIARIVGR